MTFYLEEKKKPWLYAHPDTYSDVWFLVKHYTCAITVTMNSIYTVCKTMKNWIGF